MQYNYDNMCKSLCVFKVGKMPGTHVIKHHLRFHDAMLKIEMPLLGNSSKSLHGFLTIYKNVLVRYIGIINMYLFSRFFYT